MMSELIFGENDVFLFNDALEAVLNLHLNLINDKFQL